MNHCRDCSKCKKNDYLSQNTARQIPMGNCNKKRKTIFAVKLSQPACKDFSRRIL